MEPTSTGYGDVRAIVELRAVAVARLPPYPEGREATSHGSIRRAGSQKQFLGLLVHARINGQLSGVLRGVYRRRRTTFVSSSPRDFHPRALPEPCMNLSIHTAPDVQPLP